MTTSAKTSAKKMLMSDLMQTVGILPILILIVAVFGFITPNFFTESNLLNITRQASINIVLAAGMTFIILTGGIDLSVGSILGTTAVAAMVVSLSPEFAMLSIPAALMLGLLLGLFNGALVAFAGLPPFIVTLGTYTALRGAAYLLADGTTVINSNINFEWIGNNYLGPVPWLVVIALAVIINGPPVSAVQNRVEGCQTEFKRHPDIKVLSDNQNAKGSREGGLEVMTGLLAANPKIDGVFAINDPTAIGADLAAKQAQRNEFFIVGVDGSPDAEEALKRENSLFVATPAQDPQVMAAKAVEIGYDILQGKPAPKEPVLIPVTMIDKNNVGNYKGWTVK
ncbi:substrate-binding domain-containing protein [Escherichia coli]